jgi:hypothetical protein
LNKVDFEEKPMQIRIRIPVANDVLALLVLQEVEAQSASGRSFTAYNITRALRRRQPQLDIAHQAVRPIVHKIMRTLMRDGSYEASRARFDTGTAILYIPAKRHETPLNLPLLSLGRGRAD